MGNQIFEEKKLFCNAFFLCDASFVLKTVFLYNGFVMKTNLWWKSLVKKGEKNGTFGDKENLKLWLKMTQFLTYIQNINSDHWKTDIVTKLKNSNLLHNSWDQIVAMIKKKINCDTTQKQNLWQNSKTQIVTKLINVTNL